MTDLINSREFPKVLVVNDGTMFNISQTAITQRNIFSGWPKNRLMEIYIEGHYLDSIPEDFYGIVRYRISNTRLPLRKLANISIVKRINLAVKTSITRDISKPNYNDRVSRSIKSELRQFLFSIVDRSMLLLKKEDRYAISVFKPDIIYTMGSSVTIMKLAYKIKCFTPAKLVIHFMDNWPECIQWEKNPLLRGYRRSLNKWLRKVYSVASCGLTICDEMARDYEAKTGVKHFAIYNSIPISNYACRYKEHGKELVFTYVGSLNLSRDIVASYVGGAISDICKEKKIECRFDIYTRSSLDTEAFRILRNNSRVVIHDAVLHENIKHIYEESDYLVLIESTDISSVQARFTKYSISTKTAEYLASNRPILYVGGPAKVLTTYLESNKAAFVVTDVERIKDAILEMIDGRCCNMIIKNAQSLCQRNHNIVKTTRKMREIFSEIERMDARGCNEINNNSN